MGMCCDEQSCLLKNECLRRTIDTLDESVGHAHALQGTEQRRRFNDHIYGV